LNLVIRRYETPKTNPKLMKPLRKLPSVAAWLLTAPLIQAGETILVDIQSGGIASTAANFQFYDNFISASAPVNADLNLGNPTNTATGASSTIYNITNSTDGGNYAADSSAWTDLVPILEGYRYAFSPNTVTIDLSSGLSNFEVGEEITLTVFAVGDNNNQQSRITPSYGGVPLEEGFKDTVYNGPLRKPQDSISKPSVQWKFPVEEGKTSISFEWAGVPGKANSVLNGFSISSALPGTGTIDSVTISPETSNLLLGTADVALLVLGNFSSGTINTTSDASITDYSVSPFDIVDVTPLGVVKSVGLGTATVTATVLGDSNTSAFATSTFTVVGATSITATPAATELHIGGGGSKITVTADSVPTFSNVHLNGLPDLSFESSNPDIIAVDADGDVSPGTLAGTASITITFPNGSPGGISTTVSLTNQGEIPEKPTELVHRYSFNDSAGAAPATTPLLDSVGGKNGVVMGDGAVFTGSALSIPGGDQSSGAAYGDLPNGMISALPKASTFETWISVTSSYGQERVFDFGSNDAEENLNGAGQSYFYLAARGAAPTSNPLIGYSTTSINGAVDVNATSFLTLDTPTHLVVTYDSDVGVGAIYMNGSLVARGNFPVRSDLSNLNDINNYLGRSQWAGDNRIAASYDEFRIYSGIMSESEILASGIAGPDAILGAPSNYATWALDKTLTAGVNDGFEFDPDNDGIENALEFVLGGNPLSPDQSVLPTQLITPADYVFTFSRADESESEISLTFQYGSDLSGWNDVAIGPVSAASVVVEEGTPSSNPDVITVTVPRSGTKMFGRLKAVK
jgi:hypothetical protein